MDQRVRFPHVRCLKVEVVMVSVVVVDVKAYKSCWDLEM